MKKVTCIFLFLAFFFSAEGCLIKGQIEEERYLSNAFSKNEANRNLIVYFPGEDSKFLLPEERLVKVKGSVEKQVVDEILKGPELSGKRKIELKKSDISSITRNNDTVTIKLSKRYLKGRDRLFLDDELSLYSIIDSLTELPGVKKVIFKTNSRALLASESGRIFNNPVSRNRGLLNRNQNLNPPDVLMHQMTCEQQGRWLEAYLLMSDDENNIYRKSYDDYVMEMLEVSGNGFTNQKFRVEDYKIDENGSKANIKVCFYIKDVSGNEKIEDFYFNCVKIDNIWMVDWLTAQ